MRTTTTLALTALATLAGKTLGQSDIGCWRDGQCLNSFTGPTVFNNSPQECLQYCRSVENCQHFTHYDGTGQCIPFLNCINFSQDTCEDCISGDVGCDDLRCFFTGQCQGTLLGYVEGITNTRGCRDACKENEDCYWWTFDRSASVAVCELLGSCLRVDETCTGCTSAQRDCEFQEPYECGQTVDLISVGGFTTVTSPNYPLLYDSRTNCNWYVQAREGSVVQVEYLDFALEESTSCFDYIEFYEGCGDEAQLITRQCGSTDPIGTFVSTAQSDCMKIFFYSDSSVQRRGFQLSLTTQDPPVQTSTAESTDTTQS